MCNKSRFIYRPTSVCWSKWELWRRRGIGPCLTRIGRCWLLMLMLSMILSSTRLCLQHFAVTVVFARTTVTCDNFVVSRQPSYKINLQRFSNIAAQSRNWRRVEHTELLTWKQKDIWMSVDRSRAYLKRQPSRFKTFQTYRAWRHFSPIAEIFDPNANGTRSGNRRQKTGFGFWRVCHTIWCRIFLAPDSLVG